ncbi:hypothetical protein ISREJYDI_CDS0171 [Pseudomonas phage UNO-G1W1]|uniref:NTP pyrophosphohydrolase MazG putative catalytic core domain-containing protein n=1 Tax=Pseudomonas phage UNO-G1W1 TaxID=3136609 RepID=A0AAX4MVU2_9CAUD
MDLIQRVVRTSKNVGSDNRMNTFGSLVEEVGELSTELAISNGTKQREPSPDGVVGEAIDVLVCIIDLLYQELGDKITEQAFLERVQTKLDKWENKNVLRI